MPFEHACGSIVCGGQRGTGYLVTDRWMVTCWHVVQAQQPIAVQIGGKPLTATIVRKNEISDVAVLELPESIKNVTPLHLTGGGNKGSAWEGVGYPVTSKKALALPLTGTILRMDGVGPDDQPSIILRSHEAAAGEGGLMGGYSGSPVVVGGAVVGHVKLILEDPQRRGHPLYGFLFAVPSLDILKVLEWEPDAAVHLVSLDQDRRGTKVLLEELEANRHSASRIFEFWDILRATGAMDEAVSEKAAELLIGHGRSELALEVLKPSDEGIRARQLRALAWDKLGKPDQAVSILEKLALEEHADDSAYAETHGMLGGRYRRFYKRPGDEAHLRNAYAEYRKPWDRSQDTYCGINAATMALRLKNTQTAIQIAGKIAEKFMPLDIASLDHWERATMAEAQIMLGDIDLARIWYGHAVDKAPTLFADLATIRDGAQRILAAMKQPANSVDDCFPAMCVAAFFGHDVDAPGRVPPRLPRELVGKLRERLTSTLNDLQIRFGVSSACRGSDLLFLKALLDSGGYATVVLPTNREDFARMFVGEQWRERFESVLSHERTRVQTVTAADNRDVWIVCRDAIRKEVKDRAAALSEPPRLLVVWDGNPGYVADAALSWEQEGDPVTRLTPQH